MRTRLLGNTVVAKQAHLSRGRERYCPLPPREVELDDMVKETSESLVKQES